MQGLQQGDLIGKTHKVKKPLSRVSFCKVYLGRNIENGMKVAIKVEREEMSNFLTLERDLLIGRNFEEIKRLSIGTLITWHGKHNEFQVMITKMLGFDLIYFLKKYKKFSIECIFNITQQMIEMLENIHNKNIIHRDLKSENILCKRHSDQIYLIDFGIAKISVKCKKQSMPVQLELEQSRRDDLESLGYVLIYLLKQKLSWSNSEKCENDLLERIGQLKYEIKPQELCQGCPQQILNYMTQVAELNHQQIPNYQKLKLIFN
ncbi:unnamed protein product (macronuclear) [Paramecium tetraurelia]|uniref:Casein kinase I n=1 Tax=Paramecium tetraurelia TaxID=5888 RepID=A0EE77_PARTE|nr:uncharacterized protein GSPATT00025938001 [Paramecium tetraurelia]CAK93594.1 unnamed protein product [Paramecium tetraurelia]|eukprot:XP_001460991.1 hypothetical protein (macronuclear) [Paramecium tetraurelia strain d4-2]